MGDGHLEKQCFTYEELTKLLKKTEPVSGDLMHLNRRKTVMETKTRTIMFTLQRVLNCGKVQQQNGFRNNLNKPYKADYLFVLSSTSYDAKNR